MFHTPYTTGKDYSTMYFTGQAKMWLQSVENKVESMNWDEFCDFVCLRFGMVRDAVSGTDPALNSCEADWIGSGLH